jgi:hypothetical protein
MASSRANFTFTVVLCPQKKHAVVSVRHAKPPRKNTKILPEYVCTRHPVSPTGGKQSPGPYFSLYNNGYRNIVIRDTGRRGWPLASTFELVMTGFKLQVRCWHPRYWPHTDISCLLTGFSVPALRLEQVSPLAKLESADTSFLFRNYLGTTT